MNWETVRYIFQIPLGWYKAIHARVFNAYGTNFIKVRDGDDGAMQIDVDEDAFAAAVNEVAGSGGVRSVDGVFPNPDGNIQLNAVRTVNNEAPDANGNIEIALSGTVTAVNEIPPDLDGNVDLGDLVETVDGIPPDENGNIELTGLVRSVNLLAPNSAGNVSIPAIYSINNTYTVAGSHNFNGVVFSINGATPDEHGQVMLSDMGAVETVDGIPPDENGNVELTGLVYSVNNQTPDGAGNVTIDVEGIVKSVDGMQPDDSGNVALGAVCSINGITPDANGALQLSVVESVDGHYATNGAVSFDLEGDKWLMSDSDGHITTTDETPVVVDDEKTGYIFNANGTISYRNEQYVDLSSDQTITGKKTFNNDVSIRGSHSMLVTGTVGGTTVAPDNMTVAAAFPYVKLSNPGTTAYDAYMALNQNTHRLTLQQPVGMSFIAPANQVTLASQPTDTATSSYAVATCGYVMRNAITLSGEQTISGQKTFTKEIRSKMDGLRDELSRSRALQGLRYRDENNLVVAQNECEMAANGNNILRNRVYKNINGITYESGMTNWIQNDGKPRTEWTSNYYFFSSPDTASTQSQIRFEVEGTYNMMRFIAPDNATHGGNITFLTPEKRAASGNNSFSSRIIDWTNTLALETTAGKTLRLDADENKAQLKNAPTVASTDKTSKSIATCGWVNTAIGNAAIDTSKFVTTNTTQTISGQKTFTATNTYTNNLNITGSVTATGTVTTGSESTGTSRLEYGRLYLNRDTPAMYLQNGSYTGLLYMSGSEMRLQNTTGNIQLNGINVYRQTQPSDTDAPDAKGVATLGWCNGKFGKVKTVNGNAPDSSGNITVMTGSVKTVDHESPDDQGNVQINAIRTINGNSADINGDFSGVVTSVDGIPPTDGNVQLTGYVKTINGTAPDQLGDITNVAMEVDGHQADVNGVVSFGLANGQWVKTDADGHLTTTNDTPIAVDKSQYTPKTVTKKIVTGVTWNGTTLKYKSENWQFVNGVLVNVTSNSDTTIDTPVAYSAT